MQSVAVASTTLFEDIFEINALNPDGYKQFDNVNRLQSRYKHHF